MAQGELPIDDAAIDSLSVAPGDPANEEQPAGSADAGSDAAIAERLEDDPDDCEAKLDRGLDESMDASDVPALTQPGVGDEPAPSSGFDEAAEASLRSV
ncbi:hypothetical protein OKW76_07595 [Sphingomonas sp. S1-29]|uniref:hypothetical protein n=1 Tax=Sphingomonas sp. S1-29 TaxID=2991074 RepID=UPI0022406B8E|nr:hypothetical protein [Sphingomonas sp. S1-29]UZK70875.1 hypothetical protein OKW76_07595 [Sphingomonas sp. S1-29]